MLQQSGRLVSARHDFFYPGVRFHAFKHSPGIFNELLGLNMMDRKSPVIFFLGHEPVAKLTERLHPKVKDNFSKPLEIHARQYLIKASSM